MYLFSFNTKSVWQWRIDSDAIWLNSSSNSVDALHILDFKSSSA